MLRVAFSYTSTDDVTTLSFTPLSAPSANGIDGARHGYRRGVARDATARRCPLKTQVMLLAMRHSTHSELSAQPPRNGGVGSSGARAPREEKEGQRSGHGGRDRRPMCAGGVSRSPDLCQHQFNPRNNPRSVVSAGGMQPEESARCAARRSTHGACTGCRVFSCNPCLPPTNSANGKKILGGFEGDWLSPMRLSWLSGCWVEQPETRACASGVALPHAVSAHHHGAHLDMSRKKY